jgi:hypothetical protein
MINNDNRRRAFFWYAASLLVFCTGSIIAAHYYPSGFDWQYTVASALASQKHNPRGYTWFAGALCLSMILLWQYVSVLTRELPAPLPAITGFSFVALRTGLACGAVLGLERLFIRDLSDWLYKAHEILGLLTFFGMFLGILFLLIHAMLRNKIYALPALMVSSPLVAIGVNQFWLYLQQRDLGWVDTSWREMGIPFWSSFAFWQWIAIAFLWLGLGFLIFTFTCDRKNRSPR